MNSKNCSLKKRPTQPLNPSLSKPQHSLTPWLTCRHKLTPTDHAFIPISQQCAQVKSYSEHLNQTSVTTSKQRPCLTTLCEECNSHHNHKAYSLTHSLTNTSYLMDVIKPEIKHVCWSHVDNFALNPVYPEAETLHKHNFLFLLKPSWGWFLLSCWCPVCNHQGLITR